MRDGAERDVPRVTVRATKTRGGLFRKYIVLFVAVVCVALLSSGLLEIYFSVSGAQDLVHPPATGAG